MERTVNYTSNVTVFCPEDKPYTGGDIAAMYDVGNLYWVSKVGYQ